MQTNESMFEEEAQSSIRLKISEISWLDREKLVITADRLGERETSNQERQKQQGTTSDTDSHQVRVIVSGIWTSLELTKNQIINIRDAPYDEATSQYIVGTSGGLLIIEPDNLIACTAISSALFCERKTWLNHVFAKRSSTNRFLLIGKLVHDLFTSAVTNKINDVQVLVYQLDELLCKEHIMLEIYAATWDINVIRNECLEYAARVATWVNEFMLSGPGRGRFLLSQDENISVRLRDTSDIEDLVKSREYGLKGKLDVVGNFRIYNRKARQFSDKNLSVLEVKTGSSRPCLNHTAQVALYNMLLGAQYSGDARRDCRGSPGYLAYLKNPPSLYEVKYPSYNIKRDLCFKRNRLNEYFKDFFLGPPMIDRPQSCITCERLTECQLMGDIYDLDEDKFPNKIRLARDATGHLDERFIQFFTHYHEKLTKMIHANITYQHGQNAADRDPVFPIKLLQADLCDGDPGGGQENLVCFRRSPRFVENFLPSDNLRKIRSQPDAKRIKLETPSINLRPFEFKGSLHLHCRVAVRIDRDRGKQLDESDHQVLTGRLCDLKDDKLTVSLGDAHQKTHIRPSLIYRIDRLALNYKSADLDIMRQVLVLLLSRGGRREIRVRKLVTDPEYMPQQNNEMSVSLRLNEYLGLTELHSGWEPLVFDVVSTNNYFVINERHVPDRSKLHQIVSALIEVMISLDRRVLVVAQDTDTLTELMSSLTDICKFVLIPEFHGKHTSRAQARFASNIVRVPQGNEMDVVDKYSFFIGAHAIAPVCITTFHTTRSNPLFTRQTFDYCIAYDCDRIELLVSLAPLFCCDRHIIIDIDDGQCARPHGDMPSLSDHLRGLRSNLYEINYLI